MNGRDEVRVRRRRGRDGRDPGERPGLQRETHTDDVLAGILSESAPAIGAMNIGASVHGRILRPDWSGEYPWMVWKNCASRKIEPNMPKNMNSDARFASEKVALRKSRIGSIGAGPQLPRDEERHERNAGSERRHDLGARPALPVAPDEAPDDAEQADAHEPEAGQVELATGAVASPPSGSTRAGPAGCRWGR